MFIARRNSDRRRRSERELTSPITTRSLPLLRTALGMLFVVGYKHVTPDGVKNLASSPANQMSTAGHERRKTKNLSVWYAEDQDTAELRRFWWYSERSHSLSSLQFENGES